MKYNFNYLFPILLFFFTSCKNQTEETINQALKYGEYQGVEMSDSNDSLGENQYLEEGDISVELSIVTKFPDYKTLEGLTLKQWAGYYSGYYDINKIDFPCLVYDSSKELILVSTQRTQEEFQIWKIEEAFKLYKSELNKSGFTAEEESDEVNRDGRELNVSSGQIHILEYVSPSTAYVYFSGIGANGFDYPLMYACDESYDPKLRLMGNEGLNLEYDISLLDSAFVMYKDYLNSRELLMDVSTDIELR